MRRTPAAARALADDLDEADVAGARDVRAAAQLDRPALLLRSLSGTGVPPIDTTRTSSPYFSPNSAMAPDCLGLVERHQARLDRRVLQDRWR